MAPEAEAARRVCAETFHKIRDGMPACDCGEYKRTGSWFEDGLRWQARRHQAEKELKN